MNEIHKLDRVICFTLDVHLWSGRAKLRQEDVVLGVGGKLPPGELASLGSKKLIDPEHLSKFDALKKEAHRECLKVGVRFLGGYAVPTDKAEELAKALDAIGVRFNDQKASLLSDYDEIVAKWVEKHEGWKDVIQKSAVDRQRVDSQMSFGWQSFKVVGATDNQESVLNKGLTSSSKGLAGQLYYEAAQVAANVMETSLMSREKVTQKIRSPFKTLRAKLHGLSFIDSRVKPLVETIDHVLSLLPESGPIEGLGLNAIRGLAFILSSEERMIAHGEAMIAGKQVKEAFEDSAPGFKPEPESPSATLLNTPPAIATVLAPSSPPQVAQDLFQMASPAESVPAADVFNGTMTPEIPAIPVVVPRFNRPLRLDR